MAHPSRMIRQSDFSAGEVIPQMKRRDNQEIQRAGTRQMQNFRIRSTGTPTTRPGRRARFTQVGRTETVLLPGNLRFSISFGAGSLTVRDSTDAVISSNTGYPWATATVGQISFAVVNSDILMCFPGMVPQIARRSTVSGTWSFFAFTFSTGYQGEYKAPFYRFPETYGFTMTPSAASGSITLTTSGAVFYAGHVGAIFRYKQCQIQITAVASTTSATGTVLQSLPPAQILTISTTSGFFVGQIVTGSTTSATGEVTAVGGGTITVQLKNVYSGFSTTETVVSPKSRATISAVASTGQQPSVEWDEIVMSTYRGWPAACLFDRLRVAFFNIPAIPEGVAWSAIGAYSDFLVGSDATASIFELVPGRVQVLHMAGGADQFVFTNNGVFYIPITEGNPLVPGSVQFVRITPDGSANIRPVATPDGIVYVNSGLNRLIGIIQTGAFTRPYAPQDLTEFSYHMINNPVCLVSQTNDGAFPEHYIYCVMGDGSMIAGMSTSEKKWVGWTPWRGPGLVRWCSSLSGVTLFNVDYIGNATASIVEIQDDTVNMDGQFVLSSRPSGITGAGPLSLWAGLTVDLVDNGVDYGTRSVDASGNIVKIMGDDFSSATLVVGQAYQGILEPFVSHAPEGQDVGQTQTYRRLISGAVTVQHSSGFVWLGREIPSIFWGEEGGTAPPMREDTYKCRMLGWSYDPRPKLYVNRPSDIDVLEISLEVSI